MTSSEDTIKQIQKNIRDEENESAIKLFVEENKGHSVCLELNNNLTESVILDDKERPIDLSNSAFELLKNMIANSNALLLKIANEYHTSGREFYSFFYDCISLAKYVDNLPSKFKKLMGGISSAGDLMHNRIQAEIANEYKILGHQVDLERSNKTGSKPDLNLDGIDTEVKTIISTGENTQKSFADFARRLRERHDDEALVQIDNNGMVFVCMWSHVMNNVFKEHFRGRYSTQTPVLEKGKTVLQIEGKKPFTDFYSVFDSKNFSKEIDQFALSDYKKIDPMSYLGDFRRSGFPIERSGDAKTLLQKGVVFRVG